MSDNLYKGVKGGDPSRRAAHIKSLVSISYICPSCHKEKSEVFPEGKDLTGRICVECRDIEQVQKNAEMQEKARLEVIAMMSIPVRTEAEREALLEAYAHVPRHNCISCGGKFMEAESSMPFLNDDYHRPNSIQTVSYRNNPYDYEIYGEKNPNWRCRECYDISESDI
jgi:rubredoxin